MNTLIEDGTNLEHLTSDNQWTKIVKDVIFAPVELFNNVGEAILSISKQESDKQISELKASDPKKPTL